MDDGGFGGGEELLEFAEALVLSKNPAKITLDISRVGLPVFVAIINLSFKPPARHRKPQTTRLRVQNRQQINL